MEFFIGQFIGFGDGNNPVHVFKADEIFRRELGFVAYDTDNGNFLPLRKMCG